MNKTYTATVEEDENGDAIIPLPPEMLEELGWKEGDTIDWKDNGNGSFSLTKKTEDSEWVLVEAISMFRMRYMVEVPKGKSEYALDTVVCKEAKEFSQEHLDEVITSHRVVSMDEALELFDKDNHYCKSWHKDLKIEKMFTRIGEKVDLS
jgi:hypothetical protein